MLSDSERGRFIGHFGDPNSPDTKGGVGGNGGIGDDKGVSHAGDVVMVVCLLVVGRGDGVDGGTSNVFLGWVPTGSSGAS